MKKINNKIRVGILLILSLHLSSCANIFNDKLLDLAPVEDINEEKIFTQYALFRQYADHTYSYMPGTLARLWNAMCSSMGDESRMTGGCTTVFNTGAWNGSTTNDAKAELSNMWENMYIGIRKANMIIANIDRVTDFPSQEIKKRYLGEAYFLRAYFYYELVKRWGGVPLVKRPLVLSQDNLDLPRDSYEDCVAFIVEDCDRAASGLLERTYPDQDNGRATEGAALALKSRVLLYAARPLHNPSGDIEKWRAAGEAAQAVMKLDLYSLDNDLVNLFFKTKGNEIIMNRPRQKLNFEQGHTNGTSFWVRFIVPQGYQGWGGEAVTQNMVDRFDAANGYPIFLTDEKGNPVYEADGITIKIDPRSGYNEQDPYSNRDPRLDMFVLRNDRYWYNRKTEYWEGGQEAGTTYRNVSGYSIAKFWPESHQRYKGTSTFLDYIYFRYAEILLNYAEAWNEVEGPDGEHNVRQILTDLRGRVGQQEIPLAVSASKETMRARIRNERQVELCFEEHRWYDVLQWHEGVTEFNRPICGMRITKNANGTFTYKRYKMQDPMFKEYMHLYPLPSNELYKSYVLKDNPGWS